MIYSNLHKLVLLLATLSFCSCSTVILVDKSLLPEIQLGTEGQKIVIQNFFDYTKDEYVKDKHSSLFKEGGLAFSNALIDYFKETDLVTAEIGDTLVKSEAGRMLSDVLDPEYVKYTCEQFDADMLLAIDSLNIFIDWESEGDPIIFGGAGVVKHFYLVYIPYLSLYDWDGTLIDRRSVDLVHHYRSRESITAFITIKPSLLKAYDEIIFLGNEAGVEYGSHFFSTIGTFPYKVYYGEPFKAAYRMMLNNNWADAIRELLPLAESANKKTAKRAAHNLWVAYEGFGDNANAEKWFNISIEK